VENRTAVYHATLTALERALTVSLISTPLTEGEGLFHEDVDRGVLLEACLEHGFTCIPLFREAPGEEPPWSVTRVFLASLSEHKALGTRHVGPEDLLSSDTPIRDLIRLLSRSKDHFFLVLAKNRIKGIVTRSDLEALPVRVFLDTIIAHLEGMLAEAIRQEHPDEKDWGLSQSRLQAIEELYASKKNRDSDVHRVHCTSLTDKLTIFMRSSKLWPAAQQCLSRKGREKLVESIRDLRNRLGHSLPPVLPEVERVRNMVAHGSTFADDLDSLAQVAATIDLFIESLSPGESSS